MKTMKPGKAKYHMDWPSNMPPTPRSPKITSYRDWGAGNGAKITAKYAGAAHLSGVLGFPWYRTTLPIWLRLSLGSLVLSWLIVEALDFMPF